MCRSFGVGGCVGSSGVGGLGNMGEYDASTEGCVHV